MAVTLNIGDRVKLTRSIYDRGEDHHPPRWLADKGEVLVVRSIVGDAAGQITVSHEDVTDSAFWIFCAEYEPYSEEVK
jgi:hypothetical protein